MPVLCEGTAKYRVQDEYFLNSVFSAEFPWYLARATHNFPVMTHDVMCRSYEKSAGIPNSPFYGPVRQMFNAICEANGIVVKTVYRMGLNLTFSDPSKHGDPHKDHEDFDHKVFILYLNDCDAGNTYLFDDDKNITEVIEHKRDKFVVFDGDMHAAGFCRPQQFRMLLVVTFDGDVIPKDDAKAAA